MLWLHVLSFCYFVTLYVFEIKEFNFRSFTELPCLGDFENPGPLPVLHVLKGTDDWVLWIFVISSFPTFSRSRNPLFAVSQSYNVRMTMKIQVNFRFAGARRYWWLDLMDFRNFFIPNVFEVKKSIFRSFTKLPCSGVLESSSQLPVQELYSEVQMIVSYGFSQYLHYSCYGGQAIHSWHSCWAALFRLPWKSRSASDSRGIQRYWWLCLINFHYFFTIYVFEVKESIAVIPTELSCYGDLKRLGQLPVQEVLGRILMIAYYEFSQFLHKVAQLAKPEKPRSQLCWYLV